MPGAIFPSVFKSSELAINLMARSLLFHIQEQHSLDRHKNTILLLFGQAIQRVKPHKMTPRRMYPLELSALCCYTDFALNE